MISFFLGFEIKFSPEICLTIPLICLQTAGPHLWCRARPGARERPGPRWRQEGGARCRRGAGPAEVRCGERQAGGGCAKDDGEAGEASCFERPVARTPGTHRIRGQGSPEE